MTSLHKHKNYADSGSDCKMKKNAMEAAENSL